MKLENQTTNVEGNLGMSKTAKIDESNLGKLWTMLQSPYKNPIGSIVREITSNCFDAHRDANVDDAVIIKFTKDDSGIKIHFQDVGTGMSPEIINDIYLSYLSSTKEKSNDFIGAFGIGSKSPLSYVDAFFIETRVDGKEYNYMMSKGESSPELTDLSEKDTAERNGTTISFYLKNWQVDDGGSSYSYNYQPGPDFVSFVKEIHRQLFYFTNVYVIIEESVSRYYNSNGASSNYREYTKLVEEVNTCKVYEHDLFYVRTNASVPYNEMHICLGPVTYPIDWNQIPLDRNLFQYKVGLKFDIGDLPVIQTREDLNYGKKETVDAIVKKLEQVTEHFQQSQKDKFDVVVEDFNDFKKLYRDASQTQFQYYLDEPNNIYFWIKHAGYLPKYKAAVDAGFDFSVFSHRSPIEAIGHIVESHFEFYKKLTPAGAVSKGRHADYRTQVGYTILHDNFDQFVNENFLAERDTTYNTSINKFICHQDGLNKDTPHIFKPKKLSLQMYKNDLKLGKFPREKWRTIIKFYQSQVELYKKQLAKYEDVKLTDEYKTIIRADRVTKAVDETLLLYEQGNWGVEKLYRTPTEITKNRSKVVYVYAPMNEDKQLQHILSLVNKDELIAKQQYNLVDHFSYEYARGYDDGNVQLYRHQDYVFTPDHNRIVTSKFKFKFITIATTKAKKLHNVEGAIYFKDFFNNMNITKKLANYFYFFHKMTNLCKEEIGCQEVERDFYPYLKIVNNELYQDVKAMAERVSKAYNTCSVSNYSIEHAFEEEIIANAREKGLLMDKEIDALFVKIKQYRTTYININDQPLNGLANIIHFARCGKNKVSTKFYLKYNRSQMVNLYTSKKIEDKVLLQYITQYGKHSLKEVAPSTENKLKVLTF